MNNDQAARSARRVATLIAVPAALIAGFVAFQLLRPAPPAPDPVETPRPRSSAPVAMSAPSLPQRQATVCRALLSQLPDSVRELERRPVTAGHEQNAAFGDPAITLACGGAMPSVPPTDKVYPLDAACWHADPSGTVWTTVDREVPVTITVPKDYEQPGQWVIAFSNVVAATVPTGTVPTGCRPA